MGRFRIGVDNYGLLPLGLEPLNILGWASENGAEGVQFSGLEPRHSSMIDVAYLYDMKQFAELEGLYLEWGGAQHIPRDMENWERKAIFDINRKAAEEAAILGTRIIRSCSGGLMRWDPANPPTDELLRDTAEALLAQREMLRDHDVILSIEIHFEFTTHELLRLFEMCEAEPGDWLGICLDTMNFLTMLEEPVCATRRILPWVTSTHMKDGGLLLTPEGITTFPAGTGRGVIDLPAIIDLLDGLPDPVNLSIEDHGGSFLLPIFDSRFLAEFPDLLTQEYSDLIHLAQRTGECVEEGTCAITGREEWPTVFEERIRRDLQELKAIVAERQG